MNLRKMKILNIIVGVIVLCVFFLGSFLIIEYSTLPDDFKFILWFGFVFLILMFLTYYENSFCRKGIKRFDSSLVDKNIRKKLMNYFFKENFIRSKYNDLDNFDVYENKERSNMIFRSYVTDLKFDDENQLDSDLVELFNRLLDDSSVTRKEDGGDLWYRNYVFLITDKFDEDKFKLLDQYTFVKPLSYKRNESELLGSFVIPVVLCIDDHCIYFTNTSRSPIFFENRKLDVLKLFEIDSK